MYSEPFPMCSRKNAALTMRYMNSPPITKPCQKLHGTKLAQSGTKIWSEKPLRSRRLSDKKFAHRLEPAHSGEGDHGFRRMATT